MDFMMDKLSWLLDKFGAKIPSITIPWEKFHAGMDLITPHLSTMNVLFPVDTILTILILWGTFRAILLIIWTITFVRKMLPF